MIDEFACEVVAVPPWPVDVPDPDDAPFLAVAAATGSTLVTGNLRHFPVQCRQGVTVMTPRQFVDGLSADP